MPEDGDNPILRGRLDVNEEGQMFEVDESSMPIMKRIGGAFAKVANELGDHKAELIEAKIRINAQAELLGNLVAALEHHKINVPEAVQGKWVKVVEANPPSTRQE